MNAWQPAGLAPKKAGARQPAKVAPFVGGNEATVKKKAPRRLFSSALIG
jgi:hypothetical protein